MRKRWAKTSRGRVWGPRVVRARLCGLALSATLTCALLPAQAFGAVPMAPRASALSRAVQPQATTPTGAAQAAGRTAATVATQVAAAKAATVSAADGDLAGKSGSDIPAIVHVRQFGAKGDGVADDADAIQAAFDSGATTILFEHNATYRCTHALHLHTSGVTLLGDGATLLTDAAYNSGDERFLSIHGSIPWESRASVAGRWDNAAFVRDVSVYQLNIRSQAYDPVGAPANKKSYVQQLMVQMAVNVDVWGCAFTFDEPAAGQTVDGCTSLDLYTGWHSVTIQDCELHNECDKESGGGIWIRDHFNMGASNCVFSGNTIYKVAHDEAIAVWNGESYRETDPVPFFVEDVLIRDNTITMREKVASASVMILSTRNAKNITIAHNVMDVWGSGGLIWLRGDTSGVSFASNDVTYRCTASGGSGEHNLLLFRTEDKSSFQDISGNKLQVEAASGVTPKHSYAFSGTMPVRNNTLVASMPLEDVFNGVTEAVGNTVTLNARVAHVFNNTGSVRDNAVTLAADAGAYFQFFGRTFTQDHTIQGNTFTNHASPATHTVLSLNQCTMDGHSVTLQGNRFLNDALGSSARAVFLTLKDATHQTSAANVVDNQVTGGTYGAYAEGGQGYTVSGNGPTTEVPGTSSGGGSGTDGGAEGGSGSAAGGSGTEGGGSDAAGSGAADGGGSGASDGGGASSGSSDGAGSSEGSGSGGASGDGSGSSSGDSSSGGSASSSGSGSGSSAGSGTSGGSDSDGASGGTDSGTGTGSDADSAGSASEGQGQQPEGSPSPAQDPNKPQVGWHIGSDGRWRFGDAAGTSQTGWVQSDGLWYYLSPEAGEHHGALVTGWLEEGGQWYCLSATNDGTLGRMLTGWVADGNAWYYLGSNGALVTGWVYANGWYLLNTGAHPGYRGEMLTGWVADGSAWYYLSPLPDAGQGRMWQGWLCDEGSWYYLNWDGALLVNTTAPDGSALGLDGRWIG